MSVEAVQARTAELSARLAAMSGVLPAPPAAAAPASGTPGAAAGTADDPAFAEQLDAILAGGAAPAGGAAAGGAPAPSGALADKVIATAKQFLGVPYLWGGTTPKGFDCSGFLQYVFKQHGISLPRVSKDQARAGVAVSAADARPGDLVAMDNSRARAGVDHIGMYLGGGKWIVAPRSGDVVKIQNVDLSKAVAIRRVLPAAAPAQPVTQVRNASAAPSAVPAAGGAGWANALPPAGRAFVPAFTAAGSATGVDPRLLAAVAWSESNFNAGARSPAGALGLMQIMPATARGLGVDPRNPAQAANGAARYLKENLDRFGGRLDLALAAYNAGPGAVRKHGGIPPYAETRAYVTKVLDRYVSLGGRR